MLHVRGWRSFEMLPQGGKRCETLGARRCGARRWVRDVGCETLWWETLGGRRWVGDVGWETLRWETLGGRRWVRDVAVRDVAVRDVGWETLGARRCGATSLREANPQWGERDEIFEDFK